MAEHPDMGEIRDDPLLREKAPVFSDRHDAGWKLGAFLTGIPLLDHPVVFAIPAGGVPVGIELARKLSAPFALAIVRKIRIPGTTESGFGAVTWDGEVLINEPLRDALGLSEREVDRAVGETRENVKARIVRFTGGGPFPSVKDATVILTDDGIASGFTMLAAIRSLRRKDPARIIVAIPTASRSAAQLVAGHADLVVCLNIRSGLTFAVADAYRHWYDLGDEEVLREIGHIQP